MSLIQCDEKCKFQSDGYCRLEVFGTVNSTSNKCPHFETRSFYDGKSLNKTLDGDKF